MCSGSYARSGSLDFRLERAVSASMRGNSKPVREIMRSMWKGDSQILVGRCYYSDIGVHGVTAHDIRDAGFDDLC
jgi:hypothetical protein